VVRQHRRERQIGRVVDGSISELLLANSYY
jgi:hypothetical protein